MLPKILYAETGSCIGENAGRYLGVKCGQLRPVKPTSVLKLGEDPAWGLAMARENNHKFECDQLTIRSNQNAINNDNGNPFDAKLSSEPQ